MVVVQSADLYVGPCPSPARRIMPFVLLSSGGLVATNLALMLLNLRERTLLGRVGGGDELLMLKMRSTIASIRTYGGITLWLSIAFAVAWFIWSRQRRSSERLKRHGEAGVELPLSRVAPRTLLAALGLSGIAWLLMRIGSDARVTRSVYVDAASTRTYFAAAHLLRSTAWMAFAGVALRSTSLQKAREQSPLNQPDSIGPILATTSRTASQPQAGGGALGVIEVHIYERGRVREDFGAGFRVAIDQHICSVASGRSTFRVDSGLHDVSAYYLLQYNRRRTPFHVEVAAGETVIVRFDLPTFIWQHGAMSVISRVTR